MKISKIKARSILDSRGNPTVECDVFLDSGEMGRASVPSGASVGKYEAMELRDSDGLGVTKAVKNIESEISQLVLGRDPTDQEGIDTAMIELDGTENKSRLGANAVLAVSLACARAASKLTKHPFYNYIHTLSKNPDAALLPMPLVNIINGGRHANWTTDIQEYMIVPLSAQTFSQAVLMSTKVFHSLGVVLKEKGYSTLTGDEGGYAPNVKGNKEPLELLSTAIEHSGYKLGTDISFALDIAASEFYENGKYQFKTEDKKLTSDEMITWLTELSSKFPIISIEDGLDQDDLVGWKKLTENLSSKLQIVGDDLFVTNPRRIQMGVDEQCANAVLIKPNQIGTVTETIASVKLAKDNGYKTIISHRSGETNNAAISHLAVGLSTGQIKCGSVSRGERVAKYNALLRIEEKLGKHARFERLVTRG